MKNMKKSNLIYESPLCKAIFTNDHVSALKPLKNYKDNSSFNKIDLNQKMSCFQFFCSTYKFEYDFYYYRNEPIHPLL